MVQPDTLQFTLDTVDNQRLALLCGETHKHIAIIEKFFGVNITMRGNQFKVKGEPDAIIQTQIAIEQLYNDTKKSQQFSKDQIYLTLTSTQKSWDKSTASSHPGTYQCGPIQAKSKNQEQYLHNIEHHDITFAIGPSGTGKTYLAAAYAAHALQMHSVQRIILVRPAVEAGEKLGFLPGDLSEKVDPYLRPLLDAITDLMSPERVNKLIEKQVIEVAPLAYMRGRTLNNAFIILDEAQNTTTAQMKMFLTRVGFGAKVVITGDVSQIDLPSHQQSGLQHAVKVLSDIDQIAFSYLQSKDVIRHPIVEAIVNAYECHEK